MPTVVVDSSTIISCAANCILWMFDELKKKGFKFIVPKGVEQEIISSGLKTLKYKYEAIRVMHHFINGSLVSHPKNMQQKASELLKYANSSFRVKNQYLKVLQEADAEVAALAKEINADFILTDERTLRLFFENPGSLEKLYEHRFHTNVQTDRDNLAKLKQMIGDIPVFRSVDLAAYAIDAGIFNLSISNASKYDRESRKHVIEGVLYALRFGGCGVSFEEIQEYVNLLLRPNK
ncbi:MAG: hypothetical protein PHC66_02540 [Candidatus Nanoarchaeia archaeon]|nr:hypothetical protein [Candidatus Nanoarchaeia archaeon]MDD5239697.1 hypothetical protein [Candidatus Nanoarchaeia archaeon]